MFTSFEQLKRTQYLAIHLANYFKLYVFPVPEGPCNKTPFAYFRFPKTQAFALRISDVFIIKFQSPWY